jgi:membrane protease YdiL (CAAX protease family)
MESVPPVRYGRLFLFVGILTIVWTIIAVTGERYLLARWEPGLELSDREAVTAALTAHQWGLTRCLWPALCVAGLACVWFFRARIDRQPIVQLGLGRPVLSGLGRGAALGALLSLAVGGTIAALIAELVPAGPSAPHPPPIPESLAMFAGMALAIELAMRGYLFTHLLPSGIVRAVLGSAIVFACFQGVAPGPDWWVAFLNMVLLGILLGVLRLSAGTIWPSTGFQVVWNAMLGPVLGLPVSGLPFHGVTGSRTIPDGRWSAVGGGEFGPEGGLLCTAVLALATLALVRLVAPRWDASA